MSEIWNVVSEYANGSDHPDLKVYRRDLENRNPLITESMKPEVWLRRLRHYCRIGRFSNARVLEVGCGFGWDSVALSLLGNNDVVANDILPSMIEAMRECLDSMRRKGKALKVTPLLGDICDLDLPPASFDGIFSSEAVEHVHSLELMFGKCWTLLKPSGRLVIANDSNRFNSDFREATIKMWKERDTSWEHAEWLKREIRPVEHREARPYAAMRDQIIRETAPPLDDCRKLVSATAGMIRSEIEDATRTYISLGSLPTPPEFSWCRNPETGEYAERLLDPFELKAMLTERGFKARVGHAFTKFPHRLLNNFELRPLNVKLYDWRALFVITAEKL